MSMDAPEQNALENDMDSLVEHIHEMADKWNLNNIISTLEYEIERLRLNNRKRK
jgi:hypothetical protein